MTYRYKKFLAKYIKLASRIVILITVILISFLLKNTIKKHTSNMLFKKQNSKADFYIEKFKYTKISTINNIHYDLIGTLMSHYPFMNLVKIKNPIITSMLKKKELAIFCSNYAIIENNYTKIHMLGNVRIRTTRSSTKNTLFIKTEYLLLLPDQAIAKTNQSVQIIINTFRMHTIGMIIENSMRTFEFLNHVQGTHQPHSYIKSVY